MIDHRDLDLNRRRDLEIIADLVTPGDRVLDLGCGNGRFLRYVGADRIEFFIGSHLIRPFVERKYL